MDTRAPDSAERPELHNASVDEAVAAAGACAQVHLPTGRICILEHGHSSSCDFTPAPDAYAVTAAEQLPATGDAPGTRDS